MKKQKIIKLNVKKFIRTILLVIGITMFFTFLATKSIYSYKEIETKTIYIQKGDTLWKIAEKEKETNSYYSDKDIRDIIYDIKQINNMKDSNIMAGESIKIYYR